MLIKTIALSGCCVDLLALHTLPFDGETTNDGKRCHDGSNQEGMCESIIVC